MFGLRPEDPAAIDAIDAIDAEMLASWAQAASPRYR